MSLTHRIRCWTAALLGTAAFLMQSQDCLGADSDYYRRIDNAQSVIVFVHGVLGDSKSTWTGKNNAYWPDLLAADDYFKGYDIYMYQYPTSFLNGPFSIDEISENMRLRFDADGIPAHREIIFIVHSMGGLVTRAYLLKNRTVVLRTRMAYFYSTPTTGSEIASLATLISNNPQLSKMKPMQSADYLADLQRQWLNAEFKFPSFCAYETRPTYGVKIVTQESALSLCTKRPDPLDADHITIVKPESVRDDRYLAFKTAVTQVPALAEAPENVRPKLVQLLHSRDEKYLQLEAVIQNDSDRDLLVTRFTVGKGYDYSEQMRMASCMPYYSPTYIFDSLASMATTSGLHTDKTVGFAADGEPNFKYAARYYIQQGCVSLLSFTLDADVAFVLKKGGFTSVRIRIPEAHGKPKEVVPDEREMKQHAAGNLELARPKMEPNAVCFELTVSGEQDTLRGCKKLETVDRDARP